MKINSKKSSFAYIAIAHIEYLIDAPSKEVAIQKATKSIIEPLQKLEKGWEKHRMIIAIEEVPNECLVA